MTPRRESTPEVRQQISDAFRNQKDGESLRITEDGAFSEEEYERRLKTVGIRLGNARLFMPPAQERN